MGMGWPLLKTLCYLCSVLPMLLSRAYKDNQTLTEWVNKKKKKQIYSLPYLSLFFTFPQIAGHLAKESYWFYEYAMISDASCSFICFCFSVLFFLSIPFSSWGPLHIPIYILSFLNPEDLKFLFSLLCIHCV